MKNIKKDFPLLVSSDLTYLDNASTTHKPYQVIDALSSFYSSHYSTINRGIYKLSEYATHHFESVRKNVATFINATPEEIIFTSGTTHGINFIATAWALNHIKSGDEIVLTELEHHANLLPWQEVAQKAQATLKFIPINSDGTLNLNNLEQIITKKTKLVTVIHTSNALGSHTNLTPIVDAARSVGALILLDAAQSIAHQKIDVKKLDVDFLVFSGHKIMGPTGIGILYINHTIQHLVPPYQFGGGMVFHADYYRAQWLPAPHCYEAGTPPIAQVIGLGAALEYIQTHINFDELKKHEAALCTQLISGLQAYQSIKVLGPIDELCQSGHLVSFVSRDHHHHDIGAYLDSNTIAVRTGHYCTQPLAQKMGINGSVRVSFAAYNDKHDVDHFLNVMKKLLAP